MSKKVKVLVVDDNQDFIFLLQQKLSNFNLDCITATMPEEALKKANEYIPDLILLDMNLPKMSGFGLLREFKHHSKTANIPVVVLTSLNDEEISREAINLGAVHYLTKDCSDKQLQDVIQKHTV